MVFVCILISSNRINGIEVATLGICERPRVTGSLAVESLGHSVTTRAGGAIRLINPRCACAARVTVLGL